MDTEEAPSAPRKKHLGLMIGLSVFLLFIVFFLWRVIFYYIQAQRGNVEPPRAYLQSITLDASTPTTAPSDAVLTTLATADDPSIGTDRAILTIVEFADFGCPFSREASYVVRTVAKHTDLVRYVYRDFPILDLHPQASKAAEAGECADEQGRFFDYHDKLYQNQFDLSDTALKRYAQEIGLNTTLFDVCFDTHRYASEVENDRQAGVTAGVRGTPTFFFNGRKIEGAIPRDAFATFLKQFAGIPVSVDTETQRR